MQKISVTDKKQRLAVLLRKKQARIQSLLLKPELTKKEQAFIAEEGELVNLVPEIIETLEGEDARPLPHAVDLERAVLGALMLEKKAIYSVFHFLKPEHFYTPQHVAIYQAIVNLVKKKAPVDLKTVAHQLRLDGKMEFVGVMSLSELTINHGTAANCRYHARIVVQFAMKRALISMSEAVINDAYQEEVDVFMLLRAIDKEILKVKEPITNGRQKT